MAETIVDRLHAEFATLVTILDRDAEPSLRITADDTFRKVLVLTAASFFEVALTDAIIHFVSESSARNERVVEFVRRKGLSRQYHSLFDWERSNANPFFALFGDGFKSAMEERLKGDGDLTEAVKAFLELGRERNRLIHQNLGHIALEKTAGEIFELYRRAKQFLDELPKLLQDGASAAEG